MVNEALLHIQKQLSQHSKSLALFPGMPFPTATSAISAVEAAERAYDLPTLTTAVAVNVPKLNAGQKAVYDAVITVVAAPAGDQVSSWCSGYLHAIIYLLS